MSKVDPILHELAEQIGDYVIQHLSVRLQRGTTSVAPEYLTASQVAQLTGFTPKSLENLRSKRRGPAFCRVGGSVRYRLDHVRAWIDGGGQP